VFVLGIVLCCCLPFFALGGFGSGFGISLFASQPAITPGSYTATPLVSNTPLPDYTATPIPNLPSNTPVPPALVPVTTWDRTCKDQSAKLGVDLSVVVEGPAIACHWAGSPVTMSIYKGTLATVDLGSVMLVIGNDPAVQIFGVGAVTLREARTGNVAEACAILKAEQMNLDKGNAQNGTFNVIAPYNFSCPGQ
jgi:hypothetical protein